MCEQWELMLPNYIAKALSPSDHLTLEQHLATCKSCQNALNEWKLLAKAVRSRARYRAASLPALTLQPRLKHPYSKRPVYIEQSKSILEEQDMLNQAIFNQPMRQKTHHPQGLSWTFAAAMILLLLLAGLLFWGEIQPSQSPPALSAKQQSEPTASIYEIIAADENLSLFAEAIESSPWAKDTLDNSDDITIFVPTNAALANLFSNYDDIQDHLEDLVFLHMMEGVWDKDALIAANGQRIQSQWRQRTTYGNTISPSLTSDDELILNQRAHMIEADIEATNGIIHIVDDTLLSPEELLPFNLEEFEEPTLYDVLVEDGRFTLFLNIAGSDPFLNSLLFGEAPVTLFVPDDIALQPLFDEIDDPNLYTSILYGHMVRGIWTTERFSTDSQTPRTVWQVDNSTYITSIRVTLDESGALVVNDRAWIIGTSIYAANGVINVIDAPLFELPD